MNSDELEIKIKEALVSVEDAIRISKILCTASEERIPMILNIFEKAGVFIDGLEELEEWKAYKDMAYILDIEEFVTGLFREGEVFQDRVEFRPEKFNEACKKFNVKPSCAKRALHKKRISENSYGWAEIKLHCAGLERRQDRATHCYFQRSMAKGGGD